MQNLIDREKVAAMLRAMLVRLDTLRDSDDVSEFLALPYDVSRYVRNEFKGDLFGKCGDLYSLRRMRAEVVELLNIVEILDAARATVSDDLLTRLALVTHGMFDVTFSMGIDTRRDPVTKRITLADMETVEWRNTLADALRKVVGFTRYQSLPTTGEGVNHGNAPQR